MSMDSAILFTIAGIAVLGVVLSSALAVLFHRRLARTLEQSRHSDSRYRTVVEQAADSIFLVDAETGRLIEANPSLCRRLGYSEDEIVGLKVDDILVEAFGGPDIAEFVGLTHTRSNPCYLKQRCRNGLLLDVEVTVSHLEFDGRRTLCYIAHDVTERKHIELELMRNQRRLEHLAHHDSLTGLPNRLFLRTHLEHALQACTPDNSLAVMFLDLDHFKILNDSRGHNVGDELLVEIARQLKRFIGSRGIVARLGGDEFVIVLPGVTERSAVARQADAIRDMLTTPIRVAGRVISTSVSIGVTLCPQDACDLDIVLSNADVAMYKAKEAGRSNVQFFKAEMNAPIRHRLTLEHALRCAIENQQFVVHYHPLTAIDSRRICSLEALVYWKHPQLGMVPPGKFIPIAEESGLIVPIGEHVLSTVCEQLVRWQREDVPVVPVAVNWSAVQLQRQSVVHVVQSILQATNLPPNLLALEVTEGTLLRNAKQHAASLQTLRDTGVRIQIDDFGTGYSSLGYLRELPIDTLKIDRSFIGQVDTNATDLAIVSAILAMARSLGLTVVAEGVETAAQLEVLKHHGCEIAQGFFFSRPLPADECRSLLVELAKRPSFTDTLRIRLKRGSLQGSHVR